MSDFDADIAEFKKSFATDLAGDTAQLSDDDIYAYCIEVSGDLSHLYVCSALARASEFSAQWEGVDDLAWWETLLFCLGDKYTDPRWNYQHGQESFVDSQRHLELIQQKHFTSESLESSSEELVRRDLLYSAVLDVMADVLPPNPRLLKLIVFSDDDHQIQKISFNRLNSGALKRRLWLMYNVHAGTYIPIAIYSNLLGKLFPG